MEIDFPALTNVGMIRTCSLAVRHSRSSHLCALLYLRCGEYYQGFLNGEILFRHQEDRDLGR